MFGRPRKDTPTTGNDRLSELEGVMSALDKSQAIIEFEPDGTIITANQNFLSTMGYSLDEIQGQHHSMFMAKHEQNSRSYMAFWEKLRSGEFVTLQCKRIGKGNKELWLQTSYCPVSNNRSEVVKVIKFASDVTHRKLQQADYEGQMNAIKRAQAVIEFDMQGNVLHANSNFLNAVGYSLDEIKGQHHSMFVDAEAVKSPEYEAFWQTLRGGQYVAERCQRVTKNGSAIWLQATYNPILDPDGTPVKVVKYATDVTQDKKNEDDLKQLIDETNKTMRAMAEGDLTRAMAGEFKPEFMVLKNSVNQTLQQLGSIMAKVNRHSLTLQTAANELSADHKSAQQAAHETADQTLQVASAAKQISTNVSHVVSALNEMTISVDEVAKNSTEAAQVAEKAVSLADSAKLNVNQLADSSNDIGAVIKVINSIADQTNLLALNATIEAARAGDAGKGFAVVANEVKELAKETARATEEVSIKISAIQNDSQVAVKAINDIGSTIESISETQSSIARTVESQSVASTAISRAVSDVSDGSDEIEHTINKAAKVARDNQTRADGSQKTTSEVGVLAEELSELVCQFKI